MRLPVARCLIGLVLIVGPALVQASGTYRGGPPRTSSPIDRQMYERGKRIFTGKIDLALLQTVNQGEQRIELEVLQEKLPRAIQSSRDLPGLAGKLNPDQFSELTYFLEVRYKIKSAVRVTKASP